MSKNR
jgi:bud site selection protein 31